MIKKLGIFIIILIILGVGGFLYLDSYIDKSLQAVDPQDDNKIIVEIPEGSTTNDIAEILYENNLIQDTRIFKYYAKKTKADSNLRAGIYTLSKNMHTNEIIVNLIYGTPSGNTVNITIIEGLTLEETAKSIQDQLGLNYDKLISLMEDADRFRNDYQFLIDNPNIKNLQGYLMPETYNVYIDSDEETIVKMLLKYFDDFYKSEMLALVDKSNFNTEQVVNLASIVEKEAVLDEERDDVAAVFLNRLDINMKLQSCATVNYAQGVWKERLSLDDIAIDSPYNTYVYEGLPPTPINSPGKLSILAVLEPADVDYLFFVAKNDGSGAHYFSNNYDEHIKAANEYLN